MKCISDKEGRRKRMHEGVKGSKNAGVIEGEECMRQRSVS